MVERKIIGARLRSLREERGYPQGQIAEFLNVTTSCIANWELGIRSPDVNVLGKLAEYFEVTVDYLCCRSNQRSFNKPIKETDPTLSLDLSRLGVRDREKIKNYYDFL